MQANVDTQPSISVRRPKQADWPFVLELLRTANFHRIGGREMPSFPPADCFVAEYRGRIVGVAGYEMLDETTAKTSLLVVEESKRRSGIGSALQKSRLSFLRGKGIEKVYTNCDDPKVVAWNCRHFGFYPTGRVIPKLEDFGHPDKDSWTNLRLDLASDRAIWAPDLPNNYQPDAIVHDITELPTDSGLEEIVTDLVEHMRQHERQFLAEHFKPNEEALSAVSEEALSPLLANRQWISDIVEDRQISNCIAYNFENVQDAVMDDGLSSLRSRLDRFMLHFSRRLFPQFPDLTVENTGHFWYPKGAFMGWHTNLRTPGWRCYISVADDADRSFFRYLDPSNGNIVTSWDRRWNIRLFQISPTSPLWHAVYSNTNRISLGYKIIIG